MTADREGGPARGGHDLPEQFDAIVVGSGVGGMTCASLLAQLRGLRVLVLERHYRLGGFTHSFARPGGRRWSVGGHYVGQMADGESPRAVMDLATGGRVRWRAMPSPFERYSFPGLVVDQPAGRDAYVDALAARWPEERPAISRWFREVSAAYGWFASHFPSSGERRPLPTAALRTTAAALDACGLRGPELRSVLTAQCGDYGLPPGRSAFVAHAIVASHYLDGGWYPEGGAEGIIEGARAVVEAAGGACLTSHEVEAVLVERGRAVGVRAAHGPAGHRDRCELRAPIVISDVGAYRTYEHLLAAETSAPVGECRAAIRRLSGWSSAVQLFIALRESPARLGVRGENHWLFTRFDHDAAYDRRNALLDGCAEMAYLAFSSLKDPASHFHAAEVVAPLDHAAFARWRKEPWRRRGEDYERRKEGIADALLALVERHLPGFGALVEYRELATPLTVEHFTGHAAGAIYGLPVVPDRFAARYTRIDTPVPGLLLTGSDVCLHGIVGAMLGGAATTGHVLGEGGFQRVMMAAHGARTRRVTRELDWAHP